MASDEELAAWCEAQACRSQREGWDETMRAIAAALRRPPPARAELAGRLIRELREVADGWEAAGGGFPNTVALLRKAANALAGDGT